MSGNYNFDKKMFNRLFFKLREAKTRFVVNYGGAGSSKSYSQAQMVLLRCLEKKQKVLVLRKVGATLKDSVIPLFQELISQYGNLSDDWVYNKADRELHNKVNGSSILFRGLDDPEKIKSIFGVDICWMEEATEFEEEDLNQINIRLRGKDNLQIFLTFNPIDELSWLKKRFFDSNAEDATIMHTTYKDNKFLDDAFKKQLEEYKQNDYNFYKVYCLGEFGKSQFGGEFYKKFSVHKNTVNYTAEYNPEKSLHISFDENVRPFLACSVWQMEGKHAKMIDEIAMPETNLIGVCKEIMERYGDHQAQVYIYGDASSRKEDTKLSKGENFFTLIKSYLSELYPELRVPKKNPPVAMRGLFINQIFENQYDGCQITLNINNKEAIADFENVKEDVDGTKLKKKVMDKKSGTRYEQWGHFTDSSEYFLCWIFSDSFKKFQQKKNDPSKWTMTLRQSMGCW